MSLSILILHILSTINWIYDIVARYMDDGQSRTTRLRSDDRWLVALLVRRIVISHIAVPVPVSLTLFFSNRLASPSTALPTPLLLVVISPPYQTATTPATSAPSPIKQQQMGQAQPGR